MTDKNALEQSIVYELTELFHMVLKKKNFEFQRKYYTEEERIAMVSPLSGLISEICLNPIENTFITKTENKMPKKVLHSTDMLTIYV